MTQVHGYRVRDTQLPNESPLWTPTGAAAHRTAKAHFVKEAWHDVEIAEVILKADKEGFFAAMRGEPQVLQVLRTWHLSPRGGMVENAVQQP